MEYSHSNVLHLPSHCLCISLHCSQVLLTTQQRRLQLCFPTLPYRLLQGRGRIGEKGEEGRGGEGKGKEGRGEEWRGGEGRGGEGRGGEGREGEERGEVRGRKEEVR